MQKETTINLGRSTYSSAQVNECYVCKNSKDTKLIRDLVEVFNTNKNNSRMFAFMTKGLKEVKEGNNLWYIDVSRNRNTLIGSVVDGQAKLEINTTRFLKSLGFAIDKKGFWTKPKNDSRLKAFMIHMNMYGYRARDLMKE